VLPFATARHGIWLILLLAAFFGVGLLLATSRIVRADTPSLCGNSVSFPDGELDFAIGFYQKLLDSEATRPCATAGILQTYKARADARALFDLGKTFEDKSDSLAHLFYKAAYAQDRGLKEAAEALAKLELPKETRKLQENKAKFEKALALADAGFREEARAEMISVIKESKVQPDEAVRRKIEGEPGFWYDAKRDFTEYWSGIRDMAVFAGILLAVLIVLWRLVPRVYRLTPIPDWLPNKEWLPTRRWKLDIQDFDKGATSMDIGKQVSALVEEHLRRFDSSQGRGRAGLVTGVVEATALPAEIGTAAPQLKLISSLIDFVLPPQQLVLNGFMQSSESHGAGLTVALSDTRGKEISSNVTLWADEFGLDGKDSAKTSDHYFALAEVVAIWTRFRLEEISV
jgi:hypothetical protein